MKKILLYIGSAVFAALMVYNIGESNLIARNIDVSLESIKIMAAAADGEVIVGPLCAHVTDDECWYLHPTDPSQDYIVQGTFIF